MQLYTSLTERLRVQHEAIEVIIAPVNKTSLLIHPQPGKWSIKDNIAHLAKYQPVFIDRIYRIQEGATPAFERYVAEDDPDFDTWRSWEMDVLINRLYNDRKIIIALVAGLTDAELLLKGIHTKFGELTLLQWTEFFVLHEAHHIFTIFQLANSITA